MISVQREDFDIAEQYRALREEGANAGGIATFTGLVREFYDSENLKVTEDRGLQEDSQRCNEPRVQSLTLEHYPGMTENALLDIVTRARARWDVLACRVIHRIGELHAGDQIVYVGVASTHRGDAFDAAEFIMDYLKTSAPFWKKQNTTAGSEWIESRTADHLARERWQDVPDSDVQK